MLRAEPMGLSLADTHKWVDYRYPEGLELECGRLAPMCRIAIGASHH